MTDFNNAAEPAHIVLVDDLDRASLAVTPALTAMSTLERLFEAAPAPYAFSGREVAALLRCVNQTARQGWPL